MPVISWSRFFAAVLLASGCAKGGASAVPPFVLGAPVATGGSNGAQAGSHAPAGRGGTSVGMGGSQNPLPTAGRAGSAGTAGTAGGASTELTTQACLAGLMEGGRPITACEQCICEPSGCLEQVGKMQHDVPGLEMIGCVLENTCDTECCLCGAKCSLSTYGDGPCAAEIEAAAGVRPGAGLGNVPGIMEACVSTGPPDNSCAKVARLGDCINAKCASVCAAPSTCM